MRLDDELGNELPQDNVEFYLPDMSLREIPTSTKRSFLVIMEQALSVKAESISFVIDPDGKAQIDLIIQGRDVTILKISAGIFDRFWKFLTIALVSGQGLKIKRGSDIFVLSGFPEELLNGRRVKLKIHHPIKEKDLLNDKEGEN